jgi:hypothetical protein
LASQIFLQGGWRMANDIIEFSCSHNNVFLLFGVFIKDQSSAIYKTIHNYDAALPVFHILYKFLLL